MSRPDWQAGFATETSRVIGKRLPYAAAFFIVVFSLAWLFEHYTHPERDFWFAVTLLAETIVLALAVFAVRVPAWKRFTVEISSAATVLICGLIGLYYVLTHAEAEVLVMALVYLATGTTVSLPWGVRGQLPVAVATVLAYVVPLGLGVPTSTTFSLGLLGLVAIGAMSVTGAYFFETNRKQMFQQAAELQAANQALTLANEAKNDFVANVSHELRTPLSTIMGYAELLLDNNYGELPEEVRETVRRIERSTSHLSQLINDLIDLSRIEAGRLIINIGTVPLRPLCEEMTGLAESLLHDRPIHFSVSVPDELSVDADGQRLRQILVNLIGNAVKYTEKGDIKLRARADDGEVRLEVEDTGLGIPAGEQISIFEPFVRGSRQGDSRGAGLGLSLSNRLAELMGGTITVTSVPGQGSTFTLHLPPARK